MLMIQVANARRTFFAASVLAVMSAGVGCSSASSTLTSTDTQAAALSSGVSALSGVIDELNASSGFTRRFEPKRIESPESLYSNVFDKLLPLAEAAACTRAIAQTCISGAKTVTYSSCTGAAGRISYSGTVRLDWSGDGNCDLELGETVTRTANTTLAVRGSSLAISSANGTNYRGDTLGGGGSLKQTAASTWRLDIAGHHKTLTSAGRTTYNVSLQTTAPITVTGTLARSGRTVTGGALTVHHNTANFTATYQPTNLTYSHLSCVPQSGTMTVTYSGSVDGSATVTFLGGTTARLTRDGGSQNIELDYCE